MNIGIITFIFTPESYHSWGYLQNTHRFFKCTSAKGHKNIYSILDEYGVISHESIQSKHAIKLKVAREEIYYSAEKMSKIGWFLKFKGCLVVARQFQPRQNKSEREREEKMRIIL